MAADPINKKLIALDNFSLPRDTVMRETADSMAADPIIA